MKGVNVVLALVVALATGAIGGYALGIQRTGETAAVTAPPGVSTHEVIYRIPVSQCTSITANHNVPGGSIQTNLRPCPGADEIFRYHAQSGESLFLTAQNQSHPDNRNLFSCQIEIDGEVVAKVDGIGYNAISTCSAVVP